MKAHPFSLGLLVVLGCSGSELSPPHPPTAPPVEPAPLPKAEAELPPPARAVAGAELAGDFACGPFDSKELQANRGALLNDRVRVRFLPGAVAEGDHQAGKLEVQSKGATAFVGAREMYMRGDALFERRAAEMATFGGGYEPVALAAKEGKLTIVTGVIREVPADKEMVAIAHGWFLDAKGDVLDVAVFVSRAAISDLPQCRLFALKILSGAEDGDRTLDYGSSAEVETKVSYATFRYRPAGEWILTSSMGIHDFARMHFRRRGLFPTGHTELQLALDSHPGDWASAGGADGERAGRLLGLPVTWQLTDEPGSVAGKGAWTVSDAVKNRDQAVASLQTSSGQDREEAIRFAESIEVVR